MFNPEEALREFSDGQVVPGTRYRVIRMIGAGGMGCVYDVEHTELGKRFVLKSLLRELASRSDLVLRLRNEWRALARLEHPNIVSVTDAGTASSGVPFYVMERLEGETLGARIKREVRLHPTEAARIAAEILEGLTAAHEIGIVHRDIKPPNVYILRDGSVKVLDFGIAKVHSSAANITGRGIAVGTPRYMSPEQARGDQVDGRTDLYAVGLILYEMLAGSGPFDQAGDANDVLLAHLTRTPPSVRLIASSTPPLLDSLIAALLAKDPRQRPPSARAVAQELRRFLAAPASAQPAPPAALAPVPKDTIKATPAQLGAPSAAEKLGASHTLASEGVGPVGAPPPWPAGAAGAAGFAGAAAAVVGGDTTNVDVPPTAPQAVAAPGYVAAVDAYSATAYVATPDPAASDPARSSHTRPEAPAFSERAPMSGAEDQHGVDSAVRSRMRTQRLDELIDDSDLAPTRTAVQLQAQGMGTPPPAEHTVAPAPTRSLGALLAAAAGVIALVGAAGLVAWQLNLFGAALAETEVTEPGQAEPGVAAAEVESPSAAAAGSVVPDQSAAAGSPSAPSATAGSAAAGEPAAARPQPAPQAKAADPKVAAAPAASATQAAEPAAPAEAPKVAPAPAPRPAPAPAKKSPGLEVGSGL